MTKNISYDICVFVGAYISVPLMPFGRFPCNQTTKDTKITNAKSVECMQNVSKMAKCKFYAEPTLNVCEKEENA